MLHVGDRVVGVLLVSLSLEHESTMATTALTLVAADLA